MDCKKIYSRIIREFCDYVLENNIKSLVLGISGGIDSTLVAIICRDVSEITGVKFIGRSLPIMNKSDEFSTSLLVGKAFCPDFKVVFMDWAMTGFTTTLLSDELGEEQYPENRYNYSELLEKSNIQTPIANGNIQARLRMAYLYNIASINKGIVIGTDNRTEWNLGFWTLHGDVGDFYPILDLWKTQVYELSNWLLNNKSRITEEESIVLKKSIDLTPTDGLGISNSDLDQLGASSYEIVDEILIQYLDRKRDSEIIDDSIKNKYGIDIWNNIINRHKASEFKRIAKPIKIDLTRWNVSEI